MARFSYEYINSKHGVKHKTCDACGNIYSYISGNSEPVVCENCGNKYNTPAPIHTHAPKEIKPSTHYQVRLFCSKCRYKAIMWLSKKEKKPSCPKCGESSILVNISKIRPEGDCRTNELWKPHAYPSNMAFGISPKRTRYNCPECGNSHYYLIKRPKMCGACGRKMPNVQLKSNTTE